MNLIDKFFSLPSKFYTDFVNSDMVGQLGLLITIGSVGFAAISYVLRKTRLDRIEISELQKVNETRYERIQGQERIIKDLQNQLMASESQFIERRLEQAGTARNEGSESDAIRLVKMGYDDVVNPFAECCFQLAIDHVNLSEFETRHVAEAERLARVVLLLQPNHPRAKKILAKLEVLSGGEALKRRDYSARDINWDNIDQYLGLGESPSDLATVSSHARRNYKEGKFEIAERLFRHALTISINQNGLHDANTLSLRADQASCLGSMGHAQEALDLFKTLLPDYERVLGNDHQFTLVARGNIANWTGKVGHLQKALDLFKTLLPDYERVLGNDHPSTLSTRSQIARWTGETGHLQEALNLSNELLPDHERVLGNDHIDTLTTRGSIASWTGNTGHAQKALDLLKALLPDYERVLGNDHQFTLAARSHIARWTGNTGHAQTALDLYKALLRDHERVLGNDHPDTLYTRSQIARWTGETGHLQKALDLSNELLPDHERVLGNDHIDTLTTRGSIARWTGETGHAQTALDLLKALLPNYERVLGNDHPDTLSTRSALAYWQGQV